MYAYSKSSKKKVYMIAGLSIAVLSLATLGLYLTLDKGNSIPVISEDDPYVISLPEEDKRFILPFSVEGQIVKEYFDGSDHAISDYTNLEGVYRPNQGIDYAYNKEVFDVISMMDGEVIEVKEDNLFGNSITIKSDHVSITYQSLSDVSLQKGDMVTQKDRIGKASVNTYNPELGNHVHIVVTINGELTNPKNVLGKTMQELK